MSDYIPLSVPHICGNEWKYIKECLDTEWVSSAGKYVDLFESKISEYTGSKFAVACVNCTSALMLSLKLVGVSDNDEVLVPALTFIATANAVKYLNAFPVFMDCDDFCNIDIEKVIDFLKRETKYESGFTVNKITGRKIKAIIPVHIFGNAVDFRDLVEFCNDLNIKIIEDSAESLGTKYINGRYNEKHTGTIGIIGCLSFNGNKIITTGGGGMIITDDFDIASRARYLSTQAKDDSERFIHNEVGYNFRLTNIQAALGVAQLEKLEEYINIKKNNFFKYKTLINEIEGLEFIEPPKYARNNFWMYALKIDEKKYGINRDDLMIEFKKSNVQTRPVWFLNNLQKPYQNCQTYKIQKAFEINKSVLNIPCSVNLKDNEIEKVVSVLKNSKK